MATCRPGFSVVEVARRVGIDTLLSPALRAARDADPTRAGRDVMDRFLEPARELRRTGSPVRWPVRRW